MADKVVIDTESQAQNNTRNITRNQKTIDKWIVSNQKLNKTKIKIQIMADDSSFIKKMKNAEKLISKFGRTRAEVRLTASDAATGVMEKVFKRADHYGGRSYNAALNINNSNALSAIEQVESKLKQLMSRNWQVTVEGNGQVTNPAAAGQTEKPSLFETFQGVVSTAADVLSIVDFFKVGRSGGKTANAGLGTAKGSGSVGNRVISNLVGTTGATGGGRTITSGLLKGKALSPGMAAGLGNAALAGGVAAGATAISAAKDFYAGATATNEYDKKYNYASAGSKTTGLAAGAAIGTAILPGAGTLIGAGLGGLIGWFASDKVAENIAGTGEEAEKYSMVSSNAAKVTEELKEKQKALAKVDLDKRFGKITLSAEDLERTTDNLFGHKQLSKIESTTTAITTMAESYESLKSATASFDKNMWGATIKTGSKLAQEDVDGLKTSTKQFADSSKTFLKDSQYAAESSVRLLLGNSKEADSIVKSTRDYYAPLEKQLNTESGNLTKQMNIALEDNVIMSDEQEIIDKIRDKMTTITNKIAAQQWKSDKALLDFDADLLGSDMTADSFGDLLKTAQEKGDEAAKGYKAGYGKAMSADNLSEEQQTNLKVGLLGNLGKLDMDVGNFGLDTFKEKFKGDIGLFGKDIDTMLKEGITGVDLSKSLGELFTSKDWEGTSSGIGDFLEKMAPTTAEIENYVKQFDELEKAGVKLPDDIKKQIDSMKEYLSQIDLYEILASSSEYDGQEALKKWLEENLSGDGETTTVEAEVGVKANYVNAGATGTGGTGKPKTGGTGGTGKPKSAAEKGWEPGQGLPFWLQQVNLGVPTVQINVPYNCNPVPAGGKEGGGLPGLGGGKEGGGLPGLGIPPGGFTSTETVNYTFPLQGKPGNITPLQASEIPKEQLAPKSTDGGFINVDLKGKMGKVLKKAAVDGQKLVPDSVNASVGVRITAYPIGGISGLGGLGLGKGKFARGGFIGAIPGFAAGGTVQGGPQLVTVAEEGTPEVIIPLGSKRRQRAMDLWKKTGEYLGVKGYAAGGVVGGTPQAQPMEVSSGSGSGGMTVNVGGVNLNVTAGGGQDVLAVIREQGYEVANEVAGIINTQLKGQFSNMPTR